MSDWVEVGDSSNQETVQWDKESPLTGVYKNHKENVGPNNSNIYEIESTDEINGDKDLYAVWGSAVLDSKFSQIPVGSTVRITPLGKKKNPANGREYNDFKVDMKPNPVADTFPGSEVL